MARSKKSKHELHCRILQNGRVLKDYSVTFGENSQLFVTGNGNDPLGITHYPLTRPIFLIDSSKHGTFVEIDHPWEGFILSEGNVTPINGYHDLGKSFKITQKDYASLAWNDLRILIKIAQIKKPDKDVSKVIPSKFRGSLFTSGKLETSEKLAMIFAIVAAVIVNGIFIIGVGSRSPAKPESFESLPIEYVAPFVSADHIKTAPEALQDKLDRTDYISSIFKYYRNMTNVLLNNNPENSTNIFPTLVNTVSEERNQVIEKHRRALQRKTIEEAEALSLPGSSLLAIPAIEIKSHRETTLALIERIYRLHESFEYTLKEKREFSQTFKEQTGYSWEEYQREKKVEKKRRGVFAGASRGFRQVPKEEAMYIEADELASNVEIMQNKYLSQIDAEEELTRSNLNTVLMNITGNHLSFTRSLKYISESEKLGEIAASTFGSSPIKKVVEPLIGKIDQKRVRNLLSSKRFDVQLCYESALRRNHVLEGEMAWQWVVNTMGQISDIELVQSDLADNKLARCIRKKLASWKFPRAERGSVKVMHKFKFRPIKG